MKYFCTERCFDNSKRHFHRTYYENTPYPMGNDEVKHLKSIGLLQYFREVREEELIPEETAKQPGKPVSEKEPKFSEDGNRILDQSNEKPKATVKGKPKSAAKE